MCASQPGKLKKSYRFAAVKILKNIKTRHFENIPGKNEADKLSALKSFHDQGKLISCEKVYAAALLS